MSLYSMEMYCPGDVKKYKTISVGCLGAELILVGCLWAEQFAIKLAVIFPKIQKLVFTLFSGGQGGPLIYTFDLFEV